MSGKRFALELQPKIPENLSRLAELANDLLYSNHLALRCFLGESEISPESIEESIATLQGLAPAAGYATKHFGGAYFTHQNAARIDAIRERIDLWSRQKQISSQVEAVLITALLYAADKVAHTCGHYDAFRRAPLAPTPLQLRVPEFEASKNVGNRITNENANTLVRHIEADAIYLDPPYNSRQYSDTYHLIENLARWQKPEVFGEARKMDRASLKSRYCSRNAAKALDELVQSASCRHLLLSYNNMGDRGNDRSNARISDDDIMTILGRRGKVTVHKRTFNAFTTGLAFHSAGHEERLFVCEVQSKPSLGQERRMAIEELPVGGH